MQSDSPDTEPMRMSPNSETDTENENNIQSTQNEIHQKTDCSQRVTSDGVHNSCKGSDDIKRLTQLETVNDEYIFSDRSQDKGVQSKTVTWKDELVEEPMCDNISNTTSQPESKVPPFKTEEDSNQLPEMLLHPVSEMGGPIENTIISTNVIEATTKEVSAEIEDEIDILHDTTDITVTNQALDEASIDSPQELRMTQSPGTSEDTGRNSLTPTDKSNGALAEMNVEQTGQKEIEAHCDRILDSRKKSQKSSSGFQKRGSQRRLSQLIDWKNLSEYKNPKSFREELNLPAMSPIPPSDSPNLFTNQVTNKAIHPRTAWLFTSASGSASYFNYMYLIHSNKHTVRLYCRNPLSVLISSNKYKYKNVLLLMPVNYWSMHLLSSFFLKCDALVFNLPGFLLM